MRLTPVAARLSELLGKMLLLLTVVLVMKQLHNQIAYLMEMFFYLRMFVFGEEEKNDLEFAEKLASHADMYVNDAFGAAHRAHASTQGVTNYLSPSVAGF